MNSVPQHVNDGKILVMSASGHTSFLVRDGIYFNPEIDEYEVWFDNDVTAYASTEAKAKRYLYEAWRIRKAHYEGGNNIPFNGRAMAYDDSHETGGEMYGLGR